MLQHSNRQEDVEVPLRATHGDPNRDVELPSNDDRMNPEEPNEFFDKALPRLNGSTDVFKKAKEAPGPNGISYRVFKKSQKS